MAITLALEAPIKKGDSISAFLGHIMFRSVAQTPLRSFGFAALRPEALRRLDRIGTDNAFI
jgi:hypothetical protein